MGYILSQANTLYKSEKFKKITYEIVNDTLGIISREKVDSIIANSNTDCYNMNKVLVQNLPVISSKISHNNGEVHITLIANHVLGYICDENGNNTNRYIDFNGNILTINMAIDNSSLVPVRENALDHVNTFIEFLHRIYVIKKKIPRIGVVEVDNICGVILVMGSNQRIVLGYYDIIPRIDRFVGYYDLLKIKPNCTIDLRFNNMVVLKDVDKYVR